MNDAPQSGRKIRIAANTLSQVIGKLAGAGAGFLASVWIARSYGPSGYGDFTKVTAYVTLFYLITDFGINAVFLRDESSREYPLSWADLIAIRGILSILALFLALSIAVFLPGSGTSGYPGYIKFGIILYLPTVLLQGLVTSSNAVFQKTLRYGASAAALIIGSVVSLTSVILSVSLIRPEHVLPFLVLSFLAGLLCTSIISFSSASRLFPVGHIHIGSWKRLLISSLPMGLTLAANTVYFRADSIILTLTRSASEVGVYGLAYKIFEFPLVFPTFTANAAYPFMIAALSKTSDMGSFWRFVRKNCLVMAAVSVPVTASFLIPAGYVPSIRPEFYGSVRALRILSLGLPVFFVSAGFLWAHVALSNGWFILRVYILAMFFNVTANILAVPSYGYTAAAIITVLSELIIALATGLALWRRYVSWASHA